MLVINAYSNLCRALKLGCSAGNDELMSLHTSGLTARSTRAALLVIATSDQTTNPSAQKHLLERQNVSLCHTG
eukprot:4484649-Pleurochrysis_carterae.AAC.3